MIMQEKFGCCRVYERVSQTNIAYVNTNRHTINLTAHMYITKSEFILLFSICKIVQNKLREWLAVV